jgi:hypothetical protein
VVEIRAVPPPLEWKPRRGILLHYLLWQGHTWSAERVKRGAMLTLWVEWAVPSAITQPWTVRAVFRHRGEPSEKGWQVMALEPKARTFTLRSTTQYIAQVYGWSQTWRLAQGRPLVPPHPGARFREGYPVQVPPPALAGWYDAYFTAHPASGPIPPPNQWIYAGSFGVFALQPREPALGGR